MWRTTCPDGADADARAAGPAEGERVGNGADALTGAGAFAADASTDAEALTDAEAWTASTADSCGEAMVFESAPSLSKLYLPTPVQSHRAPT